MTNTAEQVAERTIVVPSTVYNNMILSIFRSVADEHEDVEARVSTSYSQTKYMLVYVQEGISLDMNPFFSSESSVGWSLSYDAEFSRYQRTNKEFYGVPRKQLFLSRADYDAHFSKVQQKVDQAVRENIERYENE